MRRFVAFGPAFVVLITALVTLVAAPAAVRRIGYANTDAQIRLARATLDGDDILERINQAVRAIANAVEPTVVHISVEVPGPRGRQRVSQGSGWVYDERGYIVTNAHVVRGAPQIVVQFHDGRTASASVVGLDNSTDVAVIKVKTAEGLFPSARATGESLSQGDRVYAFGSPFGFKFSMSEGIVSGLGRDPRAVIGENGYTNFIQTDAAVNPGNSGGPLINVHGKVVGMNVAIATGGQPSGTSEGQSSGISFAIPLDTIESVVEQLISGGVVAKGYMGISLPQDDLRQGNPDKAEEANRVLLQAAGFTGQGVIVQHAVEGGPANKAGMLDGDIITHIGGRPVTGIAALRQLITIHRPGDKVPVRVWRKGELKELEVVLGDLSETVAGMSQAAQAFQAFGLLALSDADGGGAQIDDMRRGSAALAAGLRPGQVIVEVDGKAVSTAQECLSKLAESGFVNGRKVKLTVVRSDGTRYDADAQYAP